MKNQFAQKVLATLALLQMNLYAFAQDDLIDVDIDLGREEWYEKPLVWVGAVVLILLAGLVFRQKR